MSRNAAEAREDTLAGDEFAEWNLNVPTPNLKQLVAIGGVAALSQLYGQTGEYSLQPAERQAPGHVINSDVTVVTWNMYDKLLVHLDDLKSFTNRPDVDAVVLQEVNAHDAKALGKYFPEWHTGFMMADKVVQEPLVGFGNVIMTRQPQEDIRSISIEADSPLSTALHALNGFKTDVAQAASSEISLKNTGQGIQEKRAIAGVSIKVRVGDKLETLRIINTHITGVSRLKYKQLRTVADFAKKEHRRHGMTVVCGDLNNNTQKVQKYLGDEFAVPHDGYTHVVSKHTADHCAYSADTRLTATKYEVVRSKATDHHPVIVEFTTRQALGERALGAVK